MQTIQGQLREKRLLGSQRETEALPNTKNISKKSKEHFTEREWAEIMGSNRDTFRRAKGGAIRRNR